MENQKIMTVEEIIADFSGNTKSAVKYISLRDEISMQEAKAIVKEADNAEVKRLLTQKRIDALSHCPECGSDKITISTQTYVESQSRSFLWNLFMCIITLSIWLIWMLIRKRKEEVVEVKQAVCQSCGHSWEIDY